MIYLIYTKEQYSDAEEILHFLTEEKKLTIHSRQKNCSVLQSDSRIAQDSAIILVSNTAVEDKEWQFLVKRISKDVRIIPIGITRNADYTNPELIPRKIKEINYIRIDGKHLLNIWDSLITEKEFYDIKSMLLLNKNVWLFSKCSEDFLLTDRKKIKSYLLLFQKKLQLEDNSYFQEELSGIIDYLRISMQYAKKLLRKKILDYVKRGGAVITAIVCLFLFLKLTNTTDRLSYTNAVIGIGTSGQVAPINSIKLVDGITNPFIPDETKMELYHTLSEHLNTNWHNTPVGYNYKWALNDAQIASDERYIWSANGNGNVAKWDAYTGEIVEQTNVSSQPLLAIAVSDRENLFVTLDFDGYIFKKCNDGPWEKSPYHYDVPPYTGTELVCNGETDWAVVADTTGKLLWFDLQSGFNLIWEGQFDKILCTELTDRGLETVVRKNDFLYDLSILVDGTVNEMRIPVNIDNSCSMDILNGVIVMADSNFQIVTWSKSDPDIICPTGIVLSMPLHLRFLYDQVIVYNDRNTGTHLYDLKRHLDLGSVLKDTAVVSFLSTSHNTVMASTSQRIAYNTENIESLLPVDQINEQDIHMVYKEKTMSSDGRIQQVTIENGYITRVVLHLEEKDLTLILDGANRYFIGKSQTDTSLVPNDGTEISYYVDKPVNFVGTPTVTGITNAGETLLIGSSDGSFFEITFTEAGNYLLGAQLQIPSHAAITAIYQMPDCYYLEDTTETFWRVRTGYDSLSPEGAAAAVKERLHYAATEEIYDTVSKETLNALEVTIMPGGGTKEWE